MSDAYPKKYWWLVLVILPLVLALIAIIPKFTGGPGSGGGGSGNTISIEGSSVGGDVQIIGTQVILNQVADLALEPAAKQELETNVSRAVNLAESGFYDDAIPLFEAIAGTLKTPDVYHNLGTLYLLENRDQEALQAFKEGLAIDPGYQPIRVQLARLYQKQGKIREAMEQLEKAPDQSGTDTLLKRLERETASGNLEQEPNNDILQPNLTPLDSAVRGVIDATDDVDFFSFTTPSPPRDIYAIRVGNLSTALKLQVRLWGEDKQHLWANASYGHEVNSGQDVRHGFSARPDTTYYLSVASLSGEGPYQLSISPQKAFDAFEPNDTILQAADAGRGKVIEANLMDDSDRDFYRITGNGGSLAVSLSNRSTGLRPRLQLWRGDKSHIWSNASYGHEVTAGQDLETTFSADPAGDYYVSVSSLGGSGGYSMEIRPAR